MTKTSDNEIQATEEKNVTSPKKDIWDIISILARPISAIVTALAIAAIGYYGQHVINEISSRAENFRQKISQKEQNSRLYTQLLSSREEAESALRKDMFKEIMEGFFSDLKVSDKETNKRNGSENETDNRISNEALKCDVINNIISKKILKLEMLALNFGDSLSLGPLFSEISNDIHSILELNKNLIKDWRKVAFPYQRRLHSLAKRVAGGQLATITPKGDTFDFRVSLEELTNPDGSQPEDWYKWPDDQPNETPENKLKINEITRSITVEMGECNYDNRSVKVKLIIQNLEPFELGKGDTNISFTLDYFNFPLIDNTRLSDNERFAIVLEDFSRGEIKIKGVMFPGIYASQRDKPYLNEAIHGLNVHPKAEQKQENSEEEAHNKP